MSSARRKFVHWPHPNLPPHDPFRYQTTDGLDNPRCTNAHRAEFAAQALQTFQQACAMDEAIDTATSDLVCGLLHSSTPTSTIPSPPSKSPSTPSSARQAHSPHP